MTSVPNGKEKVPFVSGLFFLRLRQPEMIATLGLLLMRRLPFRSLPAGSTTPCPFFLSLAPSKSRFLGQRFAGLSARRFAGSLVVPVRPIRHFQPR